MLSILCIQLFDDGCSSFPCFSSVQWNRLDICIEDCDFDIVPDNDSTHKSRIDSRRSTLSSISSTCFPLNFRQLKRKSCFDENIKFNELKNDNKEDYNCTMGYPTIHQTSSLQKINQPMNNNDDDDDDADAAAPPAAAADDDDDDDKLTYRNQTNSMLIPTCIVNYDSDEKICTNHQIQRWIVASIVIQFGYCHIDSITYDGETLEDMESFMYMGSIIDEQRGSDANVKARAAFLQLKNIWNSKQLSTNIKVTIFNTNDKTVPLYGAEIWKTTTTIIKKVQVFINNCLHKILNIH
ncbi:unnamed protein product [Schistosoma curassoni]|uniref:DUF6451 domain-containing protein n=1 Tax=Schistosoma curassoni TaxID=6186 RepID=A0A183K4H6_9TREM|nr:unnamed protein product [Schistosoma curassoni]